MECETDCGDIVDILKTWDVDKMIMHVNVGIFFSIRGLTNDEQRLDCYGNSQISFLVCL